MVVSTDAGITGYASGGDGLPDAAAAGAPAGRRRPAPGRGGARDLRDDRLPRRPAVGGRGGLLGHRRQGRRRAALAPARRPRRPPAGVRLGRRAGRARRARGAGPSRWPTPASARRRSASTTPTGATTWPSSPASARRSATGSRSWSTPTRAGGCPATGPRWDVATAARVANELSRRSASTGSRSRCAARTTTATRRCAAAPTCASPPARWCARWPRPRDLVVRGGIDVLQTDVVLTGGVSGNRRIAGAGRPARPHVVAAHVVERATAWSRTCTSPAPSRRARTSRCRTTRRPGRPRAATSCCRRRCEIAADGTIAPPAGPGLGVEPDLDALEAHRIA